jgi:hypothetical protein
MSLPEALTKVLDQSIEFVYALGPIFEPTVFLVPGVVREQVQALSDAIGFDVETLNYCLGLFLCYPLALIMNTIPYGQLRHLFSFLLGAFLLQFTLGVQWIHQLVTSLIAYSLLAILPRQTTSTLVPLFAMLYLVMGHLHRQYTNYLGYDLDFTGAQMVLTQKLYMIAYNLYDGEVLSQGKDSKAAKKCSEYALPQLPNLIEFLGYTFCFSNVLSGPVFEFSVYRDVCSGQILFDDAGKPRGKIPSNVWPTLRPLLTSLINMGLFVFLGGMFPLNDPSNPQGSTPVVLTADFLAKPWHVRYGYMWVGLLAVRQKYYFAWKNSEGANNLWYAGFQGFDEEGKPKGWENGSNMNIWGFETASNVQTLSKEWNKKTSVWLTRYVYIRTNGSLIAVYSMSAFWHGFYPGYYLFFMSIPMLTVCERLGRKKISPYFSKEKWSLYGIVTILFTSLAVEYMVSPFPLLALDRSWNNWKSHYFFGHIGCVVFYLIVSMLPTPKKEKKE